MPWFDCQSDWQGPIVLDPRRAARGINRRLDLTIDPLPLTAILYMGTARKLEAAK